MPKLATEITKQLQIEARKGKDFTVGGVKASSVIIGDRNLAITFNGWWTARNKPTTLET